MDWHTLVLYIVLAPGVSPIAWFAAKVGWKARRP